MTHSDSPTLSLNKGLRQFSKTITNYLMPSIAFVGRNDTLLEQIRRGFKWTENIATIDQGDHEAYVFDQIPADYEQLLKRLPAKTIYIICHKKTPRYSQNELTLLNKSLSLTLVKPNTDSLSLQIRVMLLLKEAMYGANDSRVLFSLDKTYRNNISTLIKAVIEQRTVELCVDSLPHANAIQRLVFDPMPVEIKPLVMEKGAFTYSPKNHHRYHVLVNPSKALLNQIRKEYFDDFNVKQQPKLFIVRTRSTTNTITFDDERSVSIKAANLEQRHNDIVLMSYTATLKQSHVQSRLSYLDEKTSKEIAEKVNYEPFSYYTSACKHLKNGGGITDFKELESLIEDYDRLSLKTVISALEEDILEKLYKKAKTVDAVTQATGLPDQTYYKRIKRIRQTPNVVSLIK